MSEARRGDKALLHIEGLLEDGMQFLSTRAGAPIEVTIGSGVLLPGLEDEIVGMAPGDKKEVTVAPEDGFGPRRDDLILKLEKSSLPEDLDPEPGDLLEVKVSDGDPVQVVVIEVLDDGIMIDANHPLSGRDLFFEIELVSVE